MGEKKRMRKGIEKEESTTKGQPFAKKETKAEGKLELKQKPTLAQMRDTAGKLRDLVEERRICVGIERSDTVGTQVDVTSAGMWTSFDLGALKVLEEARERGLLFKMSGFLFSNSAGNWLERAMAARASEEQKRRIAEKNAVFLKFVEELVKLEWR